ncbi:hypothetical protein [Xenorhabdus innexi]
MPISLTAISELNPMTKIFKVPFAEQGNRVSIPDEAPSDGAVSYAQGYGEAYGRDQNEDPTARDIEREKMNGIFHDITGAVGEIQTFGAAQWSAEAPPYPLRTLVYHKQKLWQSRIENNKEEPKAGNAWVELKADMTADDVGAYSKKESDARFQVKGNYALKGESYTKPESDSKYQPQGNYQPAGNYAIRGESYTKGESDGRYQSRGNYQPAGNYALRGESYTKRESNERYMQKSRTMETVIWTGWAGEGDNVYCNRNVLGKLLYFRFGEWSQKGWHFPVLIPALTGVIPVYTLMGNNWLALRLTSSSSFNILASPMHWDQILISE